LLSDPSLHSIYIFLPFTEIPFPTQFLDKTRQKNLTLSVLDGSLYD
jgi:hypothetical protein